MEEVEKIEEDSMKCPECGSRKISMNSDGFLVCTDCGRVLYSCPISQGPDWRAYDYEQYVERAHAQPVNPLKSGGILPTKIYGQRDAHGNQLKPGKTRKVNRMSRMQEGLTPNIQKAILKARRELNSAYYKLGLTKSVIDDAMVLIKKALKLGLARGRSIRLIVSAATYHACKINNLPKTPIEIAETYGVDKSRLLDTYNLLYKNGVIKGSIKPMSSVNYAKYLVTTLDLGLEVFETARRILSAASKAGVSQGKFPEGVAAASVYISAIIHGKRCKRSELARLVKLSDTTIRNHVREILNNIEISIGL